MRTPDGVAFTREDFLPPSGKDILNPRMPIYAPQDPYPYEPDPRACRIHRVLPDGLYVYVQDLMGDIWIAPDGAHQHPKILDHAQPVQFAGDLSIEDGRIADLTNVSGTFQCDDENGLRAVREVLVQQEWEVSIDGVRFFPADGRRPIILA